MNHEIAASGIRRTRLWVYGLAEPGAGKSDLLTHLAEMLGTKSIRAARFRTNAYIPSQGPLVIDAMDEVARIAEGQLNDIVAKASASQNGVVVFASRSGEWEKARTKFVEHCFGLEPVVAHLQAFDADEQKLLFENRFPGIDFEAFSAEAHRHDLTPLLGNPEFLQLFGLAYLQNNLRFNGKTQIYADAAARLAQESNEERSSRNRPNSSVVVGQAGAVFARLLLSGSSGISLRERVNDPNYPHAGVVAGEANGDLSLLLDSKLFKPANDADEHEPVHRIVAEYLAAQYLARRIRDAGDRLSLKRCLAIIAPNGVVRDELRGLLGWLAALGGDDVQKATITLDPYAVLANGDPAQLLSSNKLLLLSCLQRFAETDPYFRRSDEWRSFNIGQFFSDETVNALRPILAGRAHSHLRGLIMELIQETTAAITLAPELQSMVVDSNANDSERIKAATLLLENAKFNGTDVFDTLLAEASTASLRILTRIVTRRGLNRLGFDRIIGLLRNLANLSLTGDRARYREGVSNYFIRDFLRQFSTAEILKYLDELTSEIRCTCGESEYSCECKFPISNIVGGLLDRYFEAVSGPHDPRKIWLWTKDLRFRRSVSGEDSKSVQTLSQDHGLRRAIHKIAFSNCSTPAACEEAERLFFHNHLHSGLRFQTGDVDAAIHDAFENDHVVLWESLYRPHNIDPEVKKPNTLRVVMRRQARQKPEFMRAWAKRNRAYQLWWIENRRHLSNRSKRYARRGAEAKLKTWESLRNNRSQIEAGEHWWWLKQFAHHYLYQPDKFYEIVDDIETACRALRNCFPFLAEHVPTLDKLSRREGTQIATVLHAACVLRWRETGNLDGVAVNILQAVKTENTSCSGIEDDEAVAFDAELNRLLLASPQQLEQFARSYIEPGLSRIDDSYTNAEWLNYKTPFQSLQTTLPLEWLRRFPDMPRHAEAVLFKMAARNSPDADVRALIQKRVARLLAELPTDADQSARERRDFWLLNSFFHDDDAQVWAILRADRNTLLKIAARSDRFSDEEDRPPELSADKLYCLLDTFVDEWPPVELPTSYGTGDPDVETAYRFLLELPWRIGRDSPEKALVVLDKLLGDARFYSYRNDLLSVRASTARKAAHNGYRAPLPSEVSALLEQRSVASVEDMRALMLDVLTEVEGQIRQAETDTLDTFYANGTHVDENTARNRIVDSLRGYMTAHRLSVVIEHHMAGKNRCDFTATEMIDGRRRLLTIEVKGQWHSELFTAAAAQLDARYASNPDAERQGIYLVLWFGPTVDVAGLKNRKYATPEDLRVALIGSMSSELLGRIDVQMMDLSRLVANPVSVSQTQPRKAKRSSPATILSDAKGTSKRSVRKNKNGPAS